MPELKRNHPPEGAPDSVDVPKRTRFVHPVASLVTETIVQPCALAVSVPQIEESMTKPLVPVANVEVVLGCAWAAVDNITADMTAMIVAAAGRRTDRTPCASEDCMPCQY